MKRCKYCVNRITDNSGASYCKMQKSSRTYNGLKPVKASSMACVMYKRKDMTKEETMEEPKELIIGFTKDDNGDWVLNTHKDYEIKEIEGKYKVIKKKPQYPKDYEECCAVLFPNSIALGKVLTSGYNCEKLKKFGELLICRDAYWKIAGKELGLGKSWEPDWKDNYQKKWTICFYQGEINLTTGPNVHRILAFPTAEMRDAFYENFKDLIEQCKELL